MDDVHDSSSLTVTADFAWLATGVEPPSWRVMRDGKDITDQPQEWTAADRARREWAIEHAELVLTAIEQRLATARAVVDRMLL